MYTDNRCRDYGGGNDDTTVTTIVNAATVQMVRNKTVAVNAVTATAMSTAYDT